MSFKSEVNEKEGGVSSESLSGSAFEPITEIAQSSVLKNLSLYMVLWTGLMTFGWMIALGIVQEGQLIHAKEQHFSLGLNRLLHR